MFSPKEKKVFVTRDIPEAGIELLRKEGFIVTVNDRGRPLSSQELLTEAKTHDALITLSGDQITADFLHACSHLDIIAQYAVGYNNIDLTAASEIGIPISNTPDVLSDATADIAFGLMIAVSRKMFYLHKTIEQGEWKFFQPKKNLGFELKNKTLGIFGLGRIGMIMAQRCQGAYQMNVIYHNRNKNVEAEKNLGAKWVSFDDLLKQSDILSVHSLLSDETKEIFNKSAFSKMKKSSLFINTSRGGVHQETDLIEALKNGIIWGAGLDVTNPEPMLPNNPLLKMENVAVLPHIGSGTIEARNGMSIRAATNIIEFYKNDHVPNIVNPEVMIRK
jgi:glyoxylate reductase